MSRKCIKNNLNKHLQALQVKPSLETEDPNLDCLDYQYSGFSFLYMLKGHKQLASTPDSQL